MNFLNYKDLLDINGFTKLFVDYINDFAKLKQYFEYDFKNDASFKERCDYLKKNYTLRNELYDVLLEQNKNFDCDEKTFFNITKVRDENTFVLVTGQQVGILGGPLYTYYKIVTLLKLVEKLNNKFTDYNFIPVFWLEGEDHDFEEINKINILTNENQIRKIEYLQKNRNNIHTSVGSRRIENFEDFFNHLSTSLPNSEFKNDILNLVKQNYYNGCTFEKSFVKFYQQLFKGSGLIFISSDDKKLKQILKKIFKRELETYPKSCKLIIDISAQLEETYHVQVKPKPINLFMHHKEGRYLIEPKGENYSLKGSRKILSKSELIDILDNSPESLSPNVVLRPICQDYLLPTVAYIAGLSEIAYFAQLKPVYDEYSIQMPIIYPRASVTILENKVAKIMEKYEINILSMMQDREKVSQYVVDFVSEVKIDSLFNETVIRINDLLNEMKFGLNYIDHTLLGSLETTRQKIIQHINVLKDKAHFAQKQKFEIALRQIEKAINNILPYNNLQERELNIINFMNKYGLNISSKLYNEIDIGAFEHQIIELP